MRPSETKQVRSVVSEELETEIYKENQLSTAQQHWSNMYFGIHSVLVNMWKRCVMSLENFCPDNR